jgi:hypothetical protein
METLENQIKETDKVLIEKNIHGEYLSEFAEIVLENQLVIMKFLKQLNIDLNAK